MCLAVPGKVVEIHGNHAVVEYSGGVRREANITLVRPEVGDYVIVHAGFAIQILSEKDALETLDLWDEMLDAEEDAGARWMSEDGDGEG